NTYPESAVAVSSTAVPALNVATQSLPQSMPPMSLVTRPPPAVTMARVTCAGAATAGAATPASHANRHAAASRRQAADHRFHAFAFTMASPPARARAAQLPIFADSG